MLEEQDINIADLTQKLDALQRPFLDGKWNLTARGGVSENEWSYEKAIQANEDSHRHELDTTEIVAEVEGEEVLVVDRTETRASELSSVDEIERIKEVVNEAPMRRIIVLDPPEFEKVRGRGLLGRLRRVWD